MNIPHLYIWEFPLPPGPNLTRCNSQLLRGGKQIKQSFSKGNYFTTAEFRLAIHTINKCYWHLKQNRELKSVN